MRPYDGCTHTMVSRRHSNPKKKKCPADFYSLTLVAVAVPLLFSWVADVVLHESTRWRTVPTYLCCLKHVFSALLSLLVFLVSI